MKHIKKLYWPRVYGVFFLVFLSSLPMEAQFGKKILNRTMDKLENQAAEEISNALVTLAMRPIRKSTDAMLKKKYKEHYGTEFDDNKYEDDAERQQALYNSLVNVYSVELPPEYVFLYEFDYEVKDDDGKEEFTMLINPEEQLFAIRSEQKGSTAIMLFDHGNDILATYEMEKKEVLAFKHSMTTSGAWNNSHTQYDPLNPEQFSLTPISKSKKFAKCQCDGVRYDSEDSDGEIYLCKDLPFSWQDMYGGMMQQVNPSEYSRYIGQELSGVPFYVYTKDKKNDSASTMEVKKWQKRTTVIHNADYKNQFNSEK